MNLLSVVSTVIYTSFFIGVMRIVTAERKNVLNLSAGAVLLTLGWWSFCNSFFFAAATPQQAFFWHKLASIGWCGFVAFTAYYFFALTGYNEKKEAWWKQALFFALPAILILMNLFGETTSLATEIIQSTNGWGYTYANSITSFKLWVYLVYVFVYFGVAFFALYKWAKKVKHKMKKEMAIGFIILDFFTILFGVVTDIVLPLIYPAIPALASIGTAFFGIGYFGFIFHYDIFNINVVISAEDILKTSHNPIFVMDENKEILKCNVAAGKLLGYNKSELIGCDFRNLMLNPVDFLELPICDDLMNKETKMQCKDGVARDVLLSASAAEDKKHNFICTIVSCQDVTALKKVQTELRIQQESYKRLADDYQRLAHLDALTKLPNRRYFFETLHRFEEHYREEQKDFAVLFMDLDNFKHINDVYGHVAGDELLKATAQKLTACLEKEELAARFGGDEFILIMPYQNAASIEKKKEKIETIFAKQIFLGSEPYQIKLSIGCAVFSQIEDAEKLMQLADQEMYGNKKNKKEGKAQSCNMECKGKM